MTTTGMLVAMQKPLPVRVRSTGQLLATADELDLTGVPNGDRWAAGLTFEAEGCGTRLGRYDINSGAWCTTDPDFEGTDDNDCTPLTFSAFMVVARETGATMTTGADWIDARNGRRFEGGVSAELANELWEGTYTGNPSLQSVASLTGLGNQALPPKTAMMLAEQYASINFRNERAVFHMRVDALAAATTDFDVVRDGSSLYSPGGHLIIADAGYSGSGPTANNNHTIPVDGSSWMYVSRAPFWKLGPARTIGGDPDGVDHSHNEITQTMIRDALVVFDTCGVIAIHIAAPDFGN